MTNPAPKAMPTQARLKEVLRYDPDTGIFIRLHPPHQGRPLTWGDGKGYVRAVVDGQAYRAHRLAWLYMTGECPAEIDHINGVPSDNRLANLRPATRTENNANRRKTENPSGFKGVSLDKKTHRWRARIRIHRQRVFLGVFDTAEQAHQAYVDAAKRLFGEYARAA